MREQGYAVAVDELEEGLTAVAAPIRNAHGDVIASMSVSGPTFRLDRARPLEHARCHRLCSVAAADRGVPPARLGRARWADQPATLAVDSDLRSLIGPSTLDVRAALDQFSDSDTLRHEA